MSIDGDRIMTTRAGHSGAAGSVVVETPVAPARDPVYTIEDFLEDQELLLADAGIVSAPRTVEEPDGRVVVMPVHFLLEVFKKKRRALSFFSRKYGRATSVSRLWRFRGVLQFLHDYRADLSRNGLARDGEPMAVREELLRYLFTRETASGEFRIPGSALTRFLYDWSHRWL